jgi:hypothetical protein
LRCGGGGGAPREELIDEWISSTFDCAQVPVEHCEQTNKWRKTQFIIIIIIINNNNNDNHRRDYDATSAWPRLLVLRSERR